MPLEIRIDLGPLEQALSDDAMEAAQTAFAQDVADDFAEDAPAGHLVPRDTGNLQDNVTVNGNEITWTEEYAGYVYHGTTKMQGRPWAEQAKGERMEDWEQYAADAIMGGLE